MVEAQPTENGSTVTLKGMEIFRAAGMLSDQVQEVVSDLLDQVEAGLRSGMSTRQPSGSGTWRAGSRGSSTARLGVGLRSRCTSCARPRLQTSPESLPIRVWREWRLVYLGRRVPTRTRLIDATTRASFLFDQLPGLDETNSRMPPRSSSRC